MKIKLIYRELKNWFYIKKIIKREINDPNTQWHKYNLRSNWYGRIYTVLSLREEDTGEELVVQNWKAMEKMRPINEYLSSLNFQEIVYPSIEKIPDSMSYLTVYSPIFRHTSFTSILLFILTMCIFISGVIYLFS